MKSDALIRRPEEIELKLALPASNLSSLEKQLARTPVLARRKATHLHLHNVYYDTPEHILRRERVALRVRRIGSVAKPQWLQTLKMGGRSDSALSQRGEWEAPVPSAELALQALKATPWSAIDPDGTVFRALAPCFVTTFDRTSWSVRRRDGNVVEVSLDVGQIAVGDKSALICELELELLAGQPTALFDIAQQIAHTIAVMPLNMSKAERGYALAQDCLNAPLHAQPPSLTSNMPLLDAAQRVLSEMFCQFTTNLNALRTSDDPEVVHQARVGWRRFRSARRLFKPVLAVDAVPSWQSLHSLLVFMGELRDLDVARTETLPPLADAYTEGDARREEKWRAMAQALTHAAMLQRKSIRYALEAPAIGSALLATTQWLEELSAPKGSGDARVDLKTSLRRWARRRIVRLHDQLKVALRDSANPDGQHRVRILSKRMRYGIEALRPLLPKRHTKRWYPQATNLQTSIGAIRDVMQAGVLAAKTEVDPGLVEFLRGVAVGQERPR
jgi:inorganic triphosphatase YgiF